MFQSFKTLFSVVIFCKLLTIYQENYLFEFWSICFRILRKSESNVIMNEIKVSTENKVSIKVYIKLWLSWVQLSTSNSTDVIRSLPYIHTIHYTELQMVRIQTIKHTTVADLYTNTTKIITSQCICIFNNFNLEHQTLSSDRMSIFTTLTINVTFKLHLQKHSYTNHKKSNWIEFTKETKAALITALPLLTSWSFSWSWRSFSLNFSSCLRPGVSLAL